MNEELSKYTGVMDEKDTENEMNPIGFLKKRFAEKLNEYYTNSGIGIQVELQDILFTDWITGDNQSSKEKDFGLCGVDDVKTRIKKYLLKYGVYDEMEEDGLLQCVSALK